MRTIQSELQRTGLCKKAKPPKQQKVVKKKIHYSQRELEDLMGMRMQTYRRVNGAFRAK